MSDYTPTPQSVRSVYAGAWNSDTVPEDELHAFHAFHGEQFDRMIAKVRADALREAADEWRKHLLATSSSYVCAESWLKNRADRIENGDNDE